MPIIPVVGRRGWKLRCVLLLLYAVVTGGAITVLYPFALMISLGFTSEVDFNDMKLIPKYLTDDGPLHGKYVFEKYANTNAADGRLKYALKELSDCYGEEFLAAFDISGWYKKSPDGEMTKEPMFNAKDPKVRQRVEDYDAFRATLSPNYFVVCMRGPNEGQILPGPSIKALGESFEQRYRHLDAINYAYGQTYVNFHPGGVGGNIPATVSDLLLRPDWWACGDVDDRLRTGALHKVNLLRQLDWYTFKASTDAKWRQLLIGRFDYQKALLEKVNLVPDDDPAAQRSALKEKFNIDVDNPQFLAIPARLPSNAAEAEVWGEFVRKNWSPRYLRAIGGADLFRNYVIERYGTIEAVNKAWGTDLKSFEDPELFPREMPMYLPSVAPKLDLAFLPGDGELTAAETSRMRSAITSYTDELYEELAPQFQRAVEWGLFVQRQLPLQYIEIIDSEQLYREFLLKKYGSLSAVNDKLGTQFESAASILPPYRECDVIEVFDQRKQLRLHYMFRNFVAVANFVALQGPAMKNTLILVILTVGTHLTVTPLAAFVLSRFRLQYTYKVLLFLIATMAFPAEVASIPSFLLMKKLHLFNTYWALILPGLANGFGIFILKSFFDSLPEELFEAARMDGAGELRQLWNVAIPLIKPILAINVLGSFTAAYGGFMWAFLVCRKESMWTLMVYLYQFQMTSGSGSLMMAALVLSSLPILILFIFTQRIILRGIILPQFK